MWEECWAIVGEVWDKVGLGLFMDECGTSVGRVWDECETNVGGLWDKCGTNLGRVG